jgi:F420-0:gamma-glutamyl ligase-like protein
MFPKHACKPTPVSIKRNISVTHSVAYLLTREERARRHRKRAASFEDAALEVGAEERLEVLLLCGQV